MNANKKIKVSTRLFFFGLSGIVGFVIDSFVLYLLKDSLGLYVGRLVSFMTAVFSTWLFNRTITFSEQDSGYSKAKEFGLYLALMAIGGGINIGVYSFLIASCSIVAYYPVSGVAAGSLAGMFINLLTSRFLLFRFRK